MSNNKRHPHADMIIAWLEGKDVQYEWNSEQHIGWRDVCKVADFEKNATYRIKPETILVNGIEVPKPESEAPRNGTVYYIPSPAYEYWYTSNIWSPYYVTENTINMARGIVHLTIENAVRHAKAMIGIEE